MDNDWKLVYTSTDLYKIELIRGVLEGDGILSVEVNKKDSSYLFGEIELYVQVNDVLKARQIIDSHQNL
jgi:hypothetical protein